jgi:hypothetical protein
MLHILDPAPDDAASLERARTILQKEIGHPSKCTLLVRGNAPGTGRLVNDAAQVADRPWRVVIWIKDARIFAERQEDALFASDAVAVLLDFNDTPAKTFGIDATLIQVDDAFRAVEIA